MKELVRIIAKSANVETVDTPNGVEVVKRDDCTIILNHNENEVDTKIKGVSTNSFSICTAIMFPPSL